VKKLTLPDGTEVTHNMDDADAAEAQRIVNGRHAFAVAYCMSKAWPYENLGKLSIEQILEIRAQDGWKNPTAV
jgi:hypothetical protein